ncbi:MAG: SUMF1/EgtB/PvdO family nonheme iron enzyme, partial [Burkholderiaceae bacterium]
DPIDCRRVLLDLHGPHRVDGDGLVHATSAARIAGPDAHFDSARLGHAERWRTELASRHQLDAVLAAQLEACLDAIPSGENDAALYFHRLALFHEDMHGEALAWTRATLGYPAPAGAALPHQLQRDPLQLAGATVHMGRSRQEPGFAFDNEMPGRTVELSPFEIDAQPVSAGQFLRFVEAGGYDEAGHWPGEAGVWRSTVSRRHPLRWRAPQGASGKEWQVRWFDRWIDLDPYAPVIHVNAFEVQAYCEWAGRRLPRAAEWEHAAAFAGAERFHWGRGVWEWTADAFEPFAGFTPGPYRDYSLPWFGNHRELRGGAFATHQRMHDVHYRNFFLPQRADVFAGFRTASKG